MQHIISMTERGTFTLPVDIRKALGITGGQQFIVTPTPTGELVLKPAATIPVEIYSEERIAEFSAEEEQLSSLLDVMRDKPL